MAEPRGGGQTSWVKKTTAQLSRTVYVDFNSCLIPMVLEALKLCTSTLRSRKSLKAWFLRIFAFFHLCHRAIDWLSCPEKNIGNLVVSMFTFKDL